MTTAPPASSSAARTDARAAAAARLQVRVVAAAAAAMGATTPTSSACNRAFESDLTAGKATEADRSEWVSGCQNLYVSQPAEECDRAIAYQQARNGDVGDVSFRRSICTDAKP